MRNNIFKQKCKRIAIVGAAVMMLAGTTTMMASANNNGQESFVFSVGTGGRGYVAKVNRNKTDNSRAYIKCTNYTKLVSSASGNSFYATAHGSTSAEGGLSVCNTSTNTTPSYLIKKADTGKHMRNYIGQTGRNYANIQYDCNSSYCSYAKFEGTWSPDSTIAQ